MRWDRKKLPESSLHVYDKDDTPVMVYNMKRLPKTWEIKKKNPEEEN